MTASNMQFEVTAEDREAIARFRQKIPVEQCDVEKLELFFASMRIQYATRAPSEELLREAQMLVVKNLHLSRTVWALVDKLGGTVAVNDADVPFDWQLGMDPKPPTLIFTSERAPAPAPKPPAVEQGKEGESHV